jgi:hypothetical protein
MKLRFLRRNILDDNQLSFADNATNQRVAHGNGLHVQAFRRRTSRSLDREFLAGLVQCHDRTERRVERLGHHFTDSLQNAVELAFRRYRVSDRRKDFDL